MLKTIIRTTACLAVSAAAFIVITRVDATAAKPRSPSVPDATEPKPAPTKPTPAPPAPKLTRAGDATPATVVAPSTALNAAPERAVTVPNWKGKRLSIALREARKLGLNVKPIDDRGDPVAAGEVLPAQPASDFRVRRMLTAAGTRVEPGADVEVRVREIEDVAAGY